MVTDVAVIVLWSNDIDLVKLVFLYQMWACFLSLVLDGLIFFFSVFKEKRQNNFMQLNNKDVFLSSYYSREGEIYIFTYWSCSLQLFPHRFLYLFSVFLLAFFFSNIINKNKLLCVLLHILCCNYGIFVVILIWKNNSPSVLLCIKKWKSESYKRELFNLHWDDL